MKVKFYGGSKDGVEREYKDDAANLTVVAMLYHPYCNQIDQEIYDMKADGNLYLRPVSGQPCQQCCNQRNAMIDSYEKKNREISLHKAVCKCEYCGIEDSYGY